jgi:UTP--glucose-1-phosphate uridylyltransferase
MEEGKWCLYLPGVCMHAVPACRRLGSGDLHHEIDPFPPNLKHDPIPTLESVGPHYLELLAGKSPLADLLEFYYPKGPSSPGSSSSDEELSFEELMGLTDREKAFENTSTSVAASQMRNALTALADTCKDPHQKEVSLYTG